MAPKVVVPTLLSIAVAAGGCLPQEDPRVTRTSLVEDAGGAMSCDFDLPLTFNPLSIAPVIERNRMYMAARRG